MEGVFSVGGEVAAGGSEVVGVDGDVLGGGGGVAEVGVGAGEGEGALAGQGAAVAGQGGGVNVQVPCPLCWRVPLSLLNWPVSSVSSAALLASTPCWLSSWPSIRRWALCGLLCRNWPCWLLKRWAVRSRAPLVWN